MKHNHKNTKQSEANKPHNTNIHKSHKTNKIQTSYDKANVPQ